MQACSRCKIEKAFEYFGKSKNRPNGYHYYCKECCKLKRQEDKPKFKDYIKRYYATNKSKMRNHKKKYKKTDKGKISIKKYNYKYKKTNRDIIRAYEQLYFRNNIIQRVAKTVRSRIRGAFFNSLKTKKTKNTHILLGCSFEEYKIYLESKFKLGMNWDNHGIDGWHIDHIIPLGSAETIKELECLCHYKNTQPLWAYENLSKGDRYGQF